MVHLIFTLTMPNPPTWNGKWTGENEKHVRVRSLLLEEYRKLPKNLIGTHYYRWNDGWTARIVVEYTENPNVKKRRLKKSAGFCGYDWMIDNLLEYGTPYGKEKKP